MKVRNMVLCGLFAASLAVCGWLSVPVAEVAITMQTFGVFLALGLLGGKLGTAAIGIYVLLGAAGLPVFSGFQGGAGVLLGVGGGYIFGFLACGIVYWLITTRFPRWELPGMLLGQLVCYLCGTVWVRILYGGSGMGIWMILAKFVLPYLIPDMIKLLAAYFLTKRLKPFV